MKTKRSLWTGLLSSLVVLTVCLARPECNAAGTAQGDHGMVASGHPLATQAGLDVLKRGGNAVDAAIAVGLTLGVVDGHNSGIGGGCIMLIRRANGRVVALDGREIAPLGATRDMFIRNGQADPNLSQIGALSIATPGALVAYNHAAVTFGKIPIREHLLRAANLAQAGFQLDASYAERLLETAQQLSVFPESRAIFLHQDGTPLRAGETLRQPDLAKTYRGIAQDGNTLLLPGTLRGRAGEVDGNARRHFV